QPSATLPSRAVVPSNPSGEVLMGFVGSMVSARHLAQLAGRMAAQGSSRMAPILTNAGPGPNVQRVKRIVIAGGTGFIGSALVRALVERGDRVSVLTRDAS